jgi:hypothetical protein
MAGTPKKSQIPVLSSRLLSPVSCKPPGAPAKKKEGVVARYAPYSSTTTPSKERTISWNSLETEVKNRLGALYFSVLDEQPVKWNSRPPLELARFILDKYGKDFGIKTVSDLLAHNFKLHIQRMKVRSPLVFLNFLTYLFIYRIA